MDTQATTYLAGHDHCAEYINEGTGIQYHGVCANVSRVRVGLGRKSVSTP
jgi:hypothetical protein